MQTTINPTTPSASTDDPATMTAVVQDVYGPGEVLELRTVDTPEVSAGDVLIRVRAASVNPGDWAIMNGLPLIARPFPLYGLRRPKHPVRGSDVAGEVLAVGADVSRFAVGDEVFGWARGAFATIAVADEGLLARKPANLSFEQAAAVPMSGTVALQALRDHGHVHAGDSVLVNGASGGVGSFAVQIAKSHGAVVTGVCSTGNMDFVRSLGADRVIDYTAEDFTRGDDRYDVILDNAATIPLRRLRHSLTPQGTLIPNGGGFDHRWMASGGRLLLAMLMFRFGRRRLGRFLVAQRREDLESLASMIDAGQVTPMIDRAYILAETAEAVDYVGRGHARGKAVIRV